MFNQGENKVIIDPEEIRDMIGVFEEYQDAYNEGDPNFSVQNLRSKYGEDNMENFLQQMQHHDKQMRRFIHDLMAKAVFMLNEIMKEWMHEKAQTLEFHSMIEEKNNEIEGYKDKLHTIQGNLSQIAMFYEKLKVQNAELLQKLNQQQQQFKEETKSIHKTFIQKQQSQKIQKSVFEQLYDNNEKLMETIHDIKNEKVIVEEQIKKMAKEHEHCDNIIERLKQKIIYLQNNMVQKMQNEINDHFYHEERLDEEQQKQESHKGSFFQNIQEKLKKKNKLSEEVVNYRMSSDIGSSFLKYESARQSQSDMSQMIPQLKEEESIYERKLTIDPYYSHYILTSQSVKIKEDCEDMLNIDMKPYYKEIIQKRIPMHLWDQWVKNRLRELIKMNHE